MDSTILRKQAEQSVNACIAHPGKSDFETALSQAISAVLNYAIGIDQPIVWNLSAENTNWSGRLIKPLDSSRSAPQPGEIYQHFKGKCYEILSGAAVNCSNNQDTSQQVVVYQSVDSGDVWVRSYDEFMSPVDTGKYPTASQYWRFEKIK